LAAAVADGRRLERRLHDCGDEEESIVSQDLELLGEIRDLLRIIAEPALAKRDAKLRSSLRTVVGASSKKAKALLLMDGSRSQATIVKEAGIDKGNLSRLVKDLAAAELIFSDQKQPRLLLCVFRAKLTADSV
jgi:hypothetical protein